MRVEIPTLILVGVIVVCLTVLVALSKITGTVYVTFLVGSVIPALFPALVKRVPQSERITDPDLNVPRGMQ